VIHIIGMGTLFGEHQMATSSFSKTIVIKTDKAADILIKALETRNDAPAPAASPTVCRIASKAELARKSGQR
jgi:hypothetical protein